MSHDLDDDGLDGLTSSLNTLTLKKVVKKDEDDGLGGLTASLNTLTLKKVVKKDEDDGLGGLTASLNTLKLVEPTLPPPSQPAQSFMHGIVYESSTYPKNFFMLNFGTDNPEWLETQESITHPGHFFITRTRTWIYPSSTNPDLFYMINPTTQKNEWIEKSGMIAKGIRKTKRQVKKTKKAKRQRAKIQKGKNTKRQNTNKT